jgi:hypothetical protein
MRHPRALAALALLVAAGSAGCPSPQPAPEGLDDLARFLFTRIDPAADARDVQEAELRDAIAQLHEELDADNLTEPFQGTLSPLTADDLAGLEGVASRADKIRQAQGLFVAMELDCTLAQLEAITLSPNGDELHPGVYEEYEKRFDSDTGPFARREEDLAQWRTTYTARPIGSAYTATTRGSIRRVRAPDDGSFALGEIGISRVYLPEPAVWEDDSEFDLDFQWETAHVAPSGKVIWVYGMWRRMVLGIFDSQSDLFINTSLGNMVKWGEQTQDACKQF